MGNRNSWEIGKEYGKRWKLNEEIWKRFTSYGNSMSKFPRFSWKSMDYVFFGFQARPSLVRSFSSLVSGVGNQTKQIFVCSLATVMPRPPTHTELDADH